MRCELHWLGMQFVRGRQSVSCTIISSAPEKTARSLLYQLSLGEARRPLTKSRKNRLVGAILIFVEFTEQAFCHEAFHPLAPV